MITDKSNSFSSSDQNTTRLLVPPMNPVFHKVPENMHALDNNQIAIDWTIEIVFQQRLNFMTLSSEK